MSEYMEGAATESGMAAIELYFKNETHDETSNSSTKPRIMNETITISMEQIVTMVIPYSLIFLTAIVGNALVVLTISINRRMRTKTNAFLLNLAISNFLLGVFCMPFTLIGLLMKEFIFGPFLCRLIPYLQAVSVCVNSWTLVSVSIERYYAICHPFKSREFRQNWSHIYRMIGSIWTFALILMSPIVIVSKLQPMSGNSGKFKCRDKWPSTEYFVAFTIFLDIILFVIPLIIMTLSFIRISNTLLKNIKQGTVRIDKSKHKVKPRNEFEDLDESEYRTVTLNCGKEANGEFSTRNSSMARSTNQNFEHRQIRIIRMLFVVVLEFFVCWTPLHTINTIALFYPHLIYVKLGYKWLSFFQLLAFLSSCTNPITYSFMNSKFRESFKSLFYCSTNSYSHDSDEQRFTFRSKSFTDSVRRPKMTADTTNLSTHSRSHFATHF